MSCGLFLWPAVRTGFQVRFWVVSLSCQLDTPGVHPCQNATDTHWSHDWSESMEHYLSIYLCKPNFLKFFLPPRHLLAIPNQHPLREQRSGGQNLKLYWKTWKSLTPLWKELFFEGFRSNPDTFGFDEFLLKTWIQATAWRLACLNSQMHWFADKYNVC